MLGEPATVSRSFYDDEVPQGLEHLGGLITRYREERHLKKYELAGMIKTTADTISEIEAGSRFPGFNMLAKLFVALEIPGAEIEEAFASVTGDLDAQAAVLAKRRDHEKVARTSRSKEQTLTYYERIRRSKGISPKR